MSAVSAVSAPLPSFSTLKLALALVVVSLGVPSLAAAIMQAMFAHASDNPGNVAAYFVLGYVAGLVSVCAGIVSAGASVVFAKEKGKVAVVAGVCLVANVVVTLALMDKGHLFLS